MLVSCAEGGLPGDSQDGPDAAPGASADADPSAPDATPGDPQTVTLRATDSDRIVSQHSIGCMEPEGKFHLENRYYRWFDLAAMGVTGSFDVSQVEFGIEGARTPNGGSQQLNVSLYQQSGAFDFSSLSSIASQSIDLPDVSLTIQPVTLSGTVASGNNLVVEVHAPDGETGPNVFAIGTNSDGERNPSFISAAGCGLSLPVATNGPELSRSDMHWVVRVTGLHTP